MQQPLRVVFGKIQADIHLGAVIHLFERYRRRCLDILATLRPPGLPATAALGKGSQQVGQVDIGEAARPAEFLRPVRRRLEAFARRAAAQLVVRFALLRVFQGCISLLDFLEPGLAFGSFEMSGWYLCASLR